MKYKKECYDKSQNKNSFKSKDKSLLAYIL